MQEDIGKAKRNGNIVTTYPVDLGKYCWQVGNIFVRFDLLHSHELQRCAPLGRLHLEERRLELRTFSYIERIRKADTDFAAILATVATICKDVIQPGVIIEPPIWFYIRFYAEQHGIPRPRLYLRQRGFCPLR
mgnify:CR=1 FL=1